MKVMRSEIEVDTEEEQKEKKEERNKGEGILQGVYYLIEGGLSGIPPVCVLFMLFSAEILN